MSDYASNSFKSKEERAKLENKHVEKAVSNAVKPRRKSELRKLTDIFVPEDVASIKRYIWSDVVIPAIKDAIEDVVHAFLRGSGGGSREKKSIPATRISYRNYYESGKDRRAVEMPRGSTYDYNDYIIETRGEAEDVLYRMDDLIDTYGSVSVADFYDLLGVPGNYTDNKYGWKNLRDAKIEHVREGYTIRLPRAIPLT